MSTTIADLIGKGIVLLFVAAIGAFVFGIIRSIRATSQRNTAFLARAIAAQDIPPGGATAALPFRPAPGAAHALWLDLTLRGPEQLTFQLQLAVRVAGAVVLQGTYPVQIDEEGDARGLPGGYGTTALNTSQRSVLGSTTISTVLKACRFDAPPMPVAGEIYASIVAPPAVTIDRARLLVTVGEAPA